MFSMAEKDFNIKVDDYLQSIGYDTFLPQRDGVELVEGRTPQGIFKKDIEELDKCDILLFILDGRVPDDGACFELGYAYAKGKECVYIKTDPRVSFTEGDNPMLTQALSEDWTVRFTEVDRIDRVFDKLMTTWRNHE